MSRVWPLAYVAWQFWLGVQTSQGVGRAVNEENETLGPFAAQLCARQIRHARATQATWPLVIDAPPDRRTCICLEQAPIKIAGFNYSQLPF